MDHLLSKEHVFLHFFFFEVFPFKDNGK